MVSASRGAARVLITLGAVISMMGPAAAVNGNQPVAGKSPVTAGKSHVLTSAGTSGKASTKASARASSRQTARTSAKKSAKSTSTAAAQAAGRKSIRNGRPVQIKRGVAAVGFEAPSASVGQLGGLHRVADKLELKSSVALVLDQDTDEVLYSKNAGAVLPIASLTKLMTALVIAEAAQPMDEVLVINQDDVDTEKGSRSRLKVGSRLTREEMLHLALMSSENRAAHALGRHFPGGPDAFVAAMNRKARVLQMRASSFVEPTGLSSQNRSSARDLAVLAKAAYEHEFIRSMSTSLSHWVELGHRQLQFVNTNRLMSNPEWEIGLQKTGYISEAGRCLVMQAHLQGRQLILVFLDSAGKYSRLGDAERVRRWLGEVGPPQARPANADSDDS